MQVQMDLIPVLYYVVIWSGCVFTVRRHNMMVKNSNGRRNIRNGKNQLDNCREKCVSFKFIACLYWICTFTIFFVEAIFVCIRHLWSSSWWRHQMETFSAWLALCAGNSPVPGEFPAQRPVTRGFDVFFDLCLNKRLSKQSWGWRFETLSQPLWRHRNVLDFNMCRPIRQIIML